MTPEAQRIAIAEACGWTAKHRADKCDGINIIRCGACGEAGHANCYGDGRGAMQFTCADSPCCEGAVPPDYLNDLNAMHEAERLLAEGDYKEEGQRRVWRERFTDEMAKLCGSTACWKTLVIDRRFETVHATAAQRAEAFLRTIGKWTTSEPASLRMP
jgi:hypothetical protein